VQVELALEEREVLRLLLAPVGVVHQAGGRHDHRGHDDVLARHVASALGGAAAKGGEEDAARDDRQLLPDAPAALVVAEDP